MIGFVFLILGLLNAKILSPFNNYWVKLGKDIDGEAEEDNSGYSITSVSMSYNGSRLVIGAKRNDGINGTDSGHTRIYKFDAKLKKWNQIGKDIDGENKGDKHGNAVALSSDGSKVVIGAAYSQNKGKFNFMSNAPNS